MAGRARTLALTVSLALAGAAAALLPACLSRYQNDETPAVRRCTACHGDATRTSASVGGLPNSCDKSRGPWCLQKAAPPYDLLGNTKSEYPGVGAHMRHLYATSTHAAVKCNQCHIVPKHVGDPGHADTKRPAEITFGSLASKGKYKPEWHEAMRSCTNTYCHRNANPVWTNPRSEAKTCGTCHAIPPPEPHPQAPTNDCGVCHSAVVDRDLDFVHPERHVDGKVEVRTPKCNECHGSDKNNAPPNDTKGNTSPTAPGVGAHQIHLAGGAFSRPLQCKECHVVPKNVLDKGHIDGAEPAEVTFTGVAKTDGRDPAFDPESLTCGNTWCHSPEPGTSKASPVWNSNPDKPLPCNGCHGTPPAAPHPQMTNCSFCHGKVVGKDNKTIINRSLHVNGVINVISLSTLKCNSCHGNDKNNAPPKDVEGETATTAMGVGAHQAHLLGSSWARAVTCNECHIVPKHLTDKGHFDTPRPAELTFSGVATAFNAKPSFDAATGTCTNVFCHGDSFVGDHKSGGSHTKPVWNKVDGSQVKCGSCHSLPPPPPHPVLTSSETCSDCHKDIRPDMTFVRPDLHVDGTVTFNLPN